MRPDTAGLLLEAHGDALLWQSPFLFPTSLGPVDLSPGTGGARAIQLLHLAGQPDCLPPGTSYLFDPTKYLGPLASSALLHDIGGALGIASMYKRGNNARAAPGRAFVTYGLSCSFGSCSLSYTSQNFYTDSFGKIDTLVEPIKRRRHKRYIATDRMSSSKLKNPKTTTQHKVANDQDHPPAKRRRLGHRALSPSTTCGANVYVRYYHNSGKWHLSVRTNLEHRNHFRLDPIHKTITPKELSLPETDLIQLLFDEGTSIDSITRATNVLRKRKGMLGKLKKKTLINILQKNELNLEFLDGVGPKWTTAQKTILQLQKMKISYIALVMDENDNLLIYKGKGRPSREETETIAADGSLKKYLHKICNDLKLKDTKHVLLALSVATDKMTRAMHMYPEVQFIDAAANMNRQKRDVLFSVVKQNTGHTLPFEGGAGTMKN